MGGANKGVRDVGAGAVAAENDELTEVPAGAVRTPREAEAEDTGDPKEEDAGALNEDEALKEEDGIGAPKLEDGIGATGAEEPVNITKIQHTQQKKKGGADTCKLVS